MTFREALVNDIQQLHEIRISVKENKLSDPGLISKADYIDFLTNKGKGWVCDIDGLLVGFSIIDSIHNNIWALFVRPEFEGKGIGKKLQSLMLDWFFNDHHSTLSLTTAHESRAEGFYRKYGWKETGKKPNGEIKFEITADNWNQNHTMCLKPDGS